MQLAAALLLVLAAACAAALPRPPTVLQSTLVTWASARTFDAARATIASAQEHGARAIVLYDAGMSEQQRAEAADWEGVGVQRLRGPLAERWLAASPIGGGLAAACALEGAVVEHAASRLGRHAVVAPGALLTAPVRYSDDLLAKVGHYFLGDERAARMGRGQCEEGGAEEAQPAFCVAPVQSFVPGSEAARDCAEYRRHLAEGAAELRHTHRCFLQSCLPAEPDALRNYSDWFDVTRVGAAPGPEPEPAAGGGAGRGPRAARSLAVVLAFDAASAEDAARAVAAWSRPEALPCRAGERYGPPADLLLADLSAEPSPEAALRVAAALAAGAPTEAALGPPLARCFRSVAPFALNGSRAEHCERVRANLSASPVDAYGGFGGDARVAGGLCDLLLQLPASPAARARHAHAFVWDPATRPLRPGWLDELRRAAAADPLAWVQGSMDRSPAPADRPEAGAGAPRPPWWNGLAATALYALEEPLAALLARVAREEGGAAPLNIAAASFLALTDYKALQEHLHRFRVADFVVHLGPRPWSAEAVRAAHPRAYLAHGPAQAFP